jgi:hypothetical protein
VFQCLSNYQKHTVWIPPSICCVCGLQCKTVVEVDVSNESDCALDFSCLHVRDSFITDLSEFQYSSHFINNCVLEKAGFKQYDEHRIILQICTACFTALNQNRLPRFSLANYFYRGVLPGEFRDLTWVEEMVCAKYRNTAHVSRIYGSPDSDASQPKIFHGNTCAHEMNVVQLHLCYRVQSPTLWT